MEPLEEREEERQQQEQDHHHHHHHHRKLHETSGRPIIVAVDHSPNSKHAFDWALSHLCRPQDTLHLLHVLPDGPKEHDESPRALFDSTSELMETLSVEAFEADMVKTEVLILSGEVGKAITEEVKRINPIALVLGKQNRGIIKSVLHGSVSEYCSHHCPCPVILVPPKEICDQSAAA